ncbi:prepilin peptidase [Paenibacillus sp. MBLB4367]|uniref:A24 family peptidase n=1 Tax=Paenibacillus sp. MBLB4367 TaxID=3384767 RepID=UPI0039082601
MVIWTLLAVLLAGAFWTDARRRIIPNWMTAGGAAVGILLNGLVGGVGELRESAMGMAAGFGLMLLLHLCGALGAGDVKLFAAIGAIGGVRFVLVCSFYSLLIAGLIAIMVLLFKGRLIALAERLLFVYVGLVFTKRFAWFQPAERTELHKFPFMYAVLPGAVVAGFEIIFL